ncbi:uncharacterized protein LOC129695366 isoform X3 [Leucoraja erinacea]|uniref:uncharacterized protein LOC129695366 isoform X3 n=1 Tax=Leucoraja erinaceus TaxID=7782 RepID=UPI002456115C|nr:uncharacterized protein LOC129695366 isoform X3 [Leucoraja erinacea]
MEIPDKVMGREGKLVVLYCKFAHPNHQYKDNITIIWREEKTQNIFFKYTNYPSSNNYKNEIVDNVGARYRPMGDPRKNDASIIINQLGTTDTNKILNCRVELTGEAGKFGRSHGRITISGDVNASMVIGKRGRGATLNCNFKHSRANSRVITILWMKGTPWEESVVFNHTRSYGTSGPGTDNVNRGGRYELVGNVDKGDASIRVRGLMLNDTNNYFCHVWIFKSSKKENIQVTQDETGLQVLVDNDRASMVIGRKGATATLPCSFSPSNRNPSSITISWMKGNPPKWSVVFRDTSPPPAANNIPKNVNKGDRYDLVGNVEQGDASIRVKGLKLDDASDYTCHVYVRYSALTTVTQDEMKLQVVDGKKNTSMVIGKRRDSATLPCSFSPLNKNPSPITVRWMKGNPREESTVFNHTHPHSVNPPSTVTVKGGGRYELVGKLDQGDASIRVKELRLDDSSDYFCYVWVRNSTQETVTQDETKLEVVVPATILELSVVSDNVTGERTLVCRAEGKPPANITWIGPGNSSLPVNISEMTVTHDPEKLLTVGELLHLTLPGKYTCVAENEHQMDTREIRLFEVGGVLHPGVYIGLPILAIGLMVFALISLKKCSQQRVCCVDASTANGRKPQGPEPGSQEPEGDPIYSVVNLNTETRNRAATQAVPTPRELDRNVDALIYSIVHIQSRSRVGVEIGKEQ